MKLLFLSLLLLSTTVFADEFPNEWWSPVDRESAPSWEILPQDARPGEVILSKRTSLGILSNFAETAFSFDGTRYPGVEGLWQSMKYPEGPDDIRASWPDITWDHKRDEVAMMTGFDAKRAGSKGSKNMKSMDINWVTYKGSKMTYRTSEKGEHYKLILRIMRAKLEQNPKVKQILLQTKDLILRPDHHQKPDAPPAWRYFKIWTDLRTELQSTED